MDQLERKKECQRLADEELSSIKSTTTTTLSSGKVTRAEIDARQAAAATATDGATSSSGRVVVVDDIPLEENLNRMTVDGLEAHTVDEAIKLLR